MKKKKDITHSGDFASNTKLNPPLGEGGAERRERVGLRAKLGFSLIELMISLIAISLITAAFAPVISKKLSSSEFTIGVGNSSEFSNTTITSTGDVEGCMLYQDNNCVICRDEYLLDSENNKCVKCENGQYLSGVECIDCPLGSICDGKEQKLCPEGKYCLGGNNIQNCPNGKWSEGGAKSASECTSCDAGYACQNGVRSECSAGQYSKTGASVCTNCDSYNSTNSAYYSTGTKNSSCTICEAGNMCTGGNKTSCDNPTFATQGSTYCSECTNCTECDNKTGNCTKCEEGYYILNNQCTPCETGYYCPGGNNSTEVSCPESCISCTSSTNCTSCKQGFEYNNGKCNPCPEGSYCSGGTATSYECSSISQGCTSCTDKNTCTNCTNGYYLNNNTCSECPQGSYCTNNSKTECIAGTYTKDTKQTSCQNCPKGYYCPKGSINPAPCPIGTYRNEEKGEKESDCTQCPSSTTSLEGSSSCLINCPQGCSDCTSSTSCNTCATGYTKFSDGTCGEGEWYLYSNYGNGGTYYISKYNVGDPKGPLGSSAKLANAGITVCNVSSSCGSGDTPRCYQGQTGGSCNATYGNYSGCNRTVCTWFGANKACIEAGYSLPTSTQASFWLSNFNNISASLGNNGLQLCTYDAYTGANLCSPRQVCLGNINPPDRSYDSYCHPCSVFLLDEGPFISGYSFHQSFTHYSSYSGVFPRQDVGAAVSVRCVKN